MEQKIGRKRFKVFAFDVESHNDEESIMKKETSIWLSSFIDETNKPEEERNYFYTIESWLDKLNELTTEKWKGKHRQIKNVIVYIYNLSFEYSFIFPKLLDRGFKFKPAIEDEDENVFNSVSNKTCASVWQCSFKFGKKNGIVILRDLSKVFPGGLANVAKSFDLPTQKGEIDYTKNRLHNYKVTDEEKLYNFKDTRIIIDILLIMQKKDDKDFWKSCSAATYSCRKMIRYAFPHAYKPMKVFRRFYPELGQDESEFLRHGVAGGITYAPARYQFKDIKEEIGHLDIHQAHPNSAYRYLMPWGEGEYFKGKPNLNHYRIRALHVLVSYSGVKLHSIIKLIGVDMATDYELWLWDFELFTMFKCYEDLKVTYLDGYEYHAKYFMWRNYYLDNYKKRLIAKKNHDNFNIQQYKLLNNSTYGKLLENGHDTIYENYIDDNGLIDSKILPNPHAKLNASFTYLPGGSCISARTRCYLVESALKLGYENVVYFDTDSIFYILNDESREGMKQLSIGDNLGDFGIEKTIKRGQFAAPKRYKIQEEQEDGSVEDVYHLAGVNFKRLQEMPRYEDLNIINGHYLIQGVQRVKGGTIIVWKPKDLGVQKKYEDIYKANAHN